MSVRAAFGIALLLLGAGACGGGNAASAPPPPPPLPIELPPLVAKPASAVPRDQPSPGDEDDAIVPISPRNPTWGSRLAAVTVVEFGDFQCPFSGRAEATLSAIRDKYGPEKLRIVWKNNPLPFHKRARPASIAAMAVLAHAGVEGFWKFHDSLFAHQGDLADENFERWAGEAGVTDLDAFRADLASNRWVDAVEADLRDGKAVGVTGTPAFYINGVALSGAQPIEKFTAMIDQEIDKAEARVAAGTPRGRIYAEMARQNHVDPPKQKDEEAPDAATVFKIPVGASPVRGKATALVTMVEFADFQCPYCERVQSTLDRLRARYGDALRIVWKSEPLPFHPQAEPAAEAALEVRVEAGEGAFWSMHDRLFASQKDLSADTIADLAVRLGASATKVRAAMSGHTHRAEIQADQDLAEDFQANGTPHFFINGRRLVGAQAEEKFTHLIDEEIAKAQAILAKGTPGSDVYAALISGGQGPALPEMKDVPTLPVGDPARGNLAAKVVVHEFADFQCPFCSRVQPAIQQVMTDYGSRVKLVWHDLPLPMHPDAPLAAQAAREAYKQKGAAAFWKLHDQMFGSQQHLNRDDLDRYAQGMGLDMGRWASALDGSAHSPEIDADKNAAGSASISGTPAFLVVARGARRGYFVNGAQDYRRFHKVIERALAEAR